MRVCISIKNEEEFNLLMKILEKKDYHWLSGRRPTERVYNIICEKRCVSIDSKNKIISGDTKKHYVNMSRFMNRINNF